MSKTNDDENVTTCEARSKLAPRKGAYWHEFNKDCHLGYYKAGEVRVWTARLDRGWRQREERLALADDFEDADGVRVMDFEQACGGPQLVACAGYEGSTAADRRSPVYYRRAPCNRD